MSASPTPLSPPTSQQLDEFYNNPAIQALADDSLWTISDSDKRPINIKHLRDFGELMGANEPSDESLMTLHELKNFAPHAINNAFFISVYQHQKMILDIEPSCPPEIARQMILNLPWEYAEISMSGRGYHLVLPIPGNMDEYPGALNRVKIQEEHKWYEILVSHYVTFTRKPLSAASPGDTAATQYYWSELYGHLAQNLEKIIYSQTVALHDLAEPDIPSKDLTIQELTKRPYKKSLKDYHQDTSRWEYGTLAYLNKRLDSIEDVLHRYSGISYDTTQRSWLIYLAAKQMLPYREKHDELRKGLPYLLYQATSVVSRS